MENHQLLKKGKILLNVELTSVNCEMFMILLPLQLKVTITLESLSLQQTKG